MVTEIVHSWLFCTSISWEIGTDFCVTPERRQDNEKANKKTKTEKVIQRNIIKLHTSYIIFAINLF